MGLCYWWDMFWMLMFLVYLIVMGLVFGVFGFDSFSEKDSLNVYSCMFIFVEDMGDLIDDFWFLYVVVGGVGMFFGWVWLLWFSVYVN